MPVPAQSTNPQAGIFQNLIVLQGTKPNVDAAAKLMSQVTPIAGAIYQILKVLPEGELKHWLTAGPIELYKELWTLIVGKKYTTGDYVLGERLNDQVYGNPNIGRQQVSNQMVDMAHKIFNQLFGVRIATSDDLDALDRGVAAYKAREASYGISDAAINRAVFLKQHFYPSSTYNVQPWDLRYFEIYPLVDRIPDYEPGKWYTGTVIGGASAVDGVIPVSAADVLDQYLGAKFDPATGNTILADGTIINPATSGGSSLIDRAVAAIKSASPVTVAAVVAAGLFVYSEVENDF